MQRILVVLFSLFLTSCISFSKKGEDVMKAADNMNSHIGEQKKKLNDNYKEYVRFYRALLKSGLAKNKRPMPSLLNKTLEMKDLAVEANGIMKKIKLRTTQMKQIAEGRDRIQDSEPEFKEVDELTDGVEGLLLELENVAKKYNRASDQFSSLARKHDLYFLKTDELRLQAEQFETNLLDIGRNVKADLKKAKAKAKTPGQKNVVREMSELSREILVEGRGIQQLLDKLLLRLSADEVAVGPHSDPKVTINRINEKMSELEKLVEEYNALAKTL